MSSPSRRTLIVAFASVYLAWGSTYLALRYVVEAMPALFAGAVRYFAAGALLYAVMRLRGAPRPTARQWLKATIAGAGTFLVGNGCVAWAEKSVPSGLAAIVCATTPLFLTLMSSATGPRPGRRELAGLLVGFAGVVVLASDKTAGGDQVGWAVAAGATASFLYGIGINLVRRHLTGLPPAAVASATLGAAALLTLPFALATWPTHAIPAKSWFSVGMLGVVCTGLAFVMYYRLIARIGATTT